MRSQLKRSTVKSAENNVCQDSYVTKIKGTNDLAPILTLMIRSVALENHIYVIIGGVGLKGHRSNLMNIMFVKNLISCQAIAPQNIW